MNEHTPPIIEQDTDQIQAPPKRRGRGKWILLLLLVLLIVFLGWWYLPVLKQYQTPPYSAQQQTVMPPTKSQENEQLIAALTSRLEALERQKAEAPILEATPHKIDLSSVPNLKPLLVALHRLEQQTNTSKPFHSELNTVLTQVPQIKETLGDFSTKLLALSETGVPSSIELAQRFEDITKNLQQPTSGKPATQTWINKSKNWFKNLVSVRYTPPKQDAIKQSDPTLNQVHDLLTQGNLSAILEHRLALDPSMQEWLQHVKDRVLLQQMIAELKPISLTLVVLAALTHESQQETEE